MPPVKVRDPISLLFRSMLVDGFPATQTAHRNWLKAIRGEEVRGQCRAEPIASRRKYALLGLLVSPFFYLAECKFAVGQSTNRCLAHLSWPGKV